MKIDKITLYIGKTLLASTMVALFLLVGLEFVFSFVNELRYVGTGRYVTQEALLFILLSLPTQIAQLFPMAALVGCLIGLGSLAARSELIVMRAAGMSIGDIIKAVFKLAIWVVLLMWIVGEWIAPMTDKWANQHKAVSLSNGQALRTQHGIWICDKSDFVHIQTIEHNQLLRGITRYQFDEEMKLQKASFAQRADYQQNHWELSDVHETRFGDNQIESNVLPTQDWYSQIAPEVLNIVGSKDLDELSLGELWQTIQYRKANHLNPRAYQLALWQKCARPVATLVMIFLAIPFVFGPLRSASMGLRILVGVLAGFGFYTVNQLFGPLVMVTALSPFIAAFLPPALFFMGGYYGLKKLF